ncbi:MAG: ATP-binding protein, partial [Anaerolineae bacterium]|nr:ATP-binding protein [Anaerolineae bacterium]
LIGGLTWARYTPLILTDVLALSMWGYLVGAFLHQHYRGDIFAFLRQPLVAVILSSFVTVLLLSLSRLASSRLADGPRIIDFVVVLWRNELPLWLFCGAGLGAMLQAVTLNPKWRLPQGGDVPSFYSRSLSAQFMVFSVPLVILSMLFSVLAVTNRSVALAREQSLQEMHRSAVTAGKGIQQFYITGRNLIEAFAEEPNLLSQDPQAQVETLNIALRVVPFFQQLLLVRDTGGEFVVVSASSLATVDAALTADELAALETLRVVGVGIEETRITQRQIRGGSPANAYSVIGTAYPEDAEEKLDPEWFLIGRALFDIHPDIQAALAALQKTRNEGDGALSYEYQGFVVDDSGWIVAHPDQAQLNTVRTLDSAASESVASNGNGTLFETLTPEGEHVLAYVYQVETLPLKVVLELPYVTVLDAARKTAGSLLIVQITFGLLLSIAIPVLSSRITRPLNSLAQAANRISRGDLKGGVDIAGEDEVAELGDAFEQMRVRLQERLNDLSLLLGIAQKVSATLDLDRGILPVLEGALLETSGVVARFIALRDNGKQAQIYSVGEAPGEVSKLDRVLTAALLRRKEPLIIPDLNQAQQHIQTETLRSVAAFPVRIEDATAGVLWVGVDSLGVFDEARVNFLSTLANQAAVLIENARLFQTAEGGRQRLAAILASTRDAILVVDAEERVLLSNPAAQRLLGIDRTAVGRPMADLGLPQPLVEALAVQTTTARRVRRYQLALPKAMRSTMSGAPEDEPLPSVEVPLEDGRTFYASVAPIKSSESVTLGVVVVMRDITHFKELDAMKSEFVATVSHDLRAPLTFMRGYTTMLSMVGDLNERQRDYMQRILEGIEQMNSLVGDLLDLRRVESDIGIRQEPCRLGLVMVEAVEAVRARATAKGVDLRLEPSEGSPTVVGDRTLLRQSISNLVDNAVKYTPSGGEVNVGLDITEDTATVRVSDTGIGIAPGDQERLFEKFYRIKRRETGNVQGTGLGLALVKSIVQRHGGRVWAESVLNEGSTFYIQLPLPPEDADETPI